MAQPVRGAGVMTLAQSVFARIRIFSRKGLHGVGRGCLRQSTLEAIISGRQMGLVLANKAAQGRSPVSKAGVVLGVATPIFLHRSYASSTTTLVISGPTHRCRANVPRGRL